MYLLGFLRVFSRTLVFHSDRYSVMYSGCYFLVHITRHVCYGVTYNFMFLSQLSYSGYENSDSIILVVHVRLLIFCDYFFTLFLKHLSFYMTQIINLVNYNDFTIKKGIIGYFNCLRLVLVSFDKISITVRLKFQIYFSVFLTL